MRTMTSSTGFGMREAARWMLAGFALAFVAGCTAHSSTSTGPTTVSGTCTSPADHEITIKFDASGCPTDVEVAMTSRCGADPRCVRASKGARMIRWKADTEGVTYGIFFDPLVGPQYISKGGCVRKAVSGKAPPVSGQDPVEYKYAVVTMKSVTEIDPDCNALDPKVIVEH